MSYAFSFNRDYPAYICLQQIDAIDEAERERRPYSNTPMLADNGIELFGSETRHFDGIPGLCRVSVVLRPKADADQGRIPRRGRPAYGTAGYLTGEAVEGKDRTSQLCWTRDRANLWEEHLTHNGDLTVAVVIGRLEVIRPLVTAEVEHFDTQALWMI